MKIFLFSLFLYSLLSTPYSLFLHAYPPGWSDDILLTPEDLKERVKPDVFIDQFNCVWAVWDSGYFVNNTGEVLFSKRDSFGNCIIPETDLSIGLPYSILPRIAVDASNNIQFIWREISPEGFGIGHAKLANDGSTLVPSHLAVSGAGSPFISSLLPGMVINKYQEINIIWDEHDAMMWTKLDSMGDTIVAKIQISPQNVPTLWPGIGIDSFGNCHMAYRADSGTSDRLAYTKVDKDGNFIIPIRFFGFGSLATLIADHSQNIHIVYADPSGPGNSIEYLKLDQNGDVLIGPKTLSIHEENSWPHMAIDSLQYLHVVWTFDNFVDTAGLMYAKLDTLGDFVMPPMPVVYPPYGVRPYEPRIAVDHSNRLHLVWMDQRVDSNATEDIFYKRGENETTVQEISTLQNVKQNTLRVYPNPFTDEIRMQVLTKELTNSTMSIFDGAGRKVKQYSNVKPNGEIFWPGTDNAGNLLPAGVYFVEYTVDKTRTFVKLIKLR